MKLFACHTRTAWLGAFPGPSPPYPAHAWTLLDTRAQSVRHTVLATYSPNCKATWPAVQIASNRTAGRRSSCQWCPHRALAGNKVPSATGTLKAPKKMCSCSKKMCSCSKNVSFRRPNFYITPRSSLRESQSVMQSCAAPAIVLPGAAVTSPPQPGPPPPHAQAAPSTGEVSSHTLGASCASGRVPVTPSRGRT